MRLPDPCGVEEVEERAPEHTTTRILCLGNELICDDAVGIRVGRLLGGIDLPPNVIVDTRPAIGLDLIDVLTPGERLIIVDATKTGRKPGEYTTMVWGDVESAAVALYCCHGLGIAEAMKLCRLVAPERIPSHVVLVGLEGEVFDRFGLEMSPAVRRAFPVLVEVVLRLVGASEHVIARARAQAKAHATADLETVCGATQL